MMGKFRVTRRSVPKPANLKVSEADWAQMTQGEREIFLSFSKANRKPNKSVRVVATRDVEPVTGN